MGLTQDDTDPENMGYKKLTPKGADARAKDWLSKGRHGPCMGAMLKDPKDAQSGPADANEEAKTRARNLISEKQSKMLGTLLKELGKVCDCTSKAGIFAKATLGIALPGDAIKGSTKDCRPNSAVLGQIILDPALMNRFYSCEDNHLGALFNFHQNRDPDLVSPAGKTSAKFLEIDTHETLGRYGTFVSDAKTAKLAMMATEKLAPKDWLKFDEMAERCK